MSKEWVIKPIDTAPLDGREILLINPEWDTMPKAKWDWYELPEEDGTGGFCLWHIVDEYWWYCEEGVLWPDLNVMPTHWAEINEVGE